MTPPAKTTRPNRCVGGQSGNFPRETAMTRASRIGIVEAAVSAALTGCNYYGLRYKVIRPIQASVSRVLRPGQTVEGECNVVRPTRRTKLDAELSSCASILTSATGDSTDAHDARRVI